MMLLLTKLLDVTELPPSVAPLSPAAPETLAWTSEEQMAGPTLRRFQSSHVEEWRNTAARHEHDAGVTLWPSSALLT